MSQNVETKAQTSGSKQSNPRTYDQCYICRRWWWQSVLTFVRVPDQVGYIEKYVCPDCTEEIDRRLLPEARERG